MNQLVTAALAKAKTQIGVREVGNSNTGVEVGKYLASVGLDPGYPWCAAFVNWCIATSAGELGIKSPWLATGGCDLLRQWASEHDILFGQPQPGDVFLLCTSAGYAHHTGFVSSLDQADFNTIEGNTNTDGGRDGIGVFARERNTTPAYKFVRWSLLMPGEQPATYTVNFLGGVPPLGGKVINGVVFVPVRAWASRLGLAVEWDQYDQSISMQGHKLPVQATMIEGTSYVPIRALASFSGLTLTPDNTAKTILVRHA